MKSPDMRCLSLFFTRRTLYLDNACDFRAFAIAAWYAIGWRVEGMPSLESVARMRHFDACACYFRCIATPTEPNPVVCELPVNTEIKSFD